MSWFNGLFNAAATHIHYPLSHDTVSHNSLNTIYGCSVYLLLQLVHAQCMLTVYTSWPHVHAVPHSQEWVDAFCSPPLCTVAYCTANCSLGGAGMGPFFVWSMMAYTGWCPAAWIKWNKVFCSCNLHRYLNRIVLFCSDTGQVTLKNVLPSCWLTDYSTYAPSLARECLPYWLYLGQH